MSRQIVSVGGFLLFDRAEILEQIWTIWDGISNHFDQTWFNIIQQGSKNLIQSKIERIGLISGCNDFASLRISNLRFSSTRFALQSFIIRNKITSIIWMQLLHILNADFDKRLGIEAISTSTQVWLKFHWHHVVAHKLKLIMSLLYFS